MKTQNWKKLGRIFVPDKTTKWMVSHAAVPFIRHIKDNVATIYFTTRDAANKSNLAWLDFDLRRMKIKQKGKMPLLAPDQSGMFDSDGVMGSQVFRIKDKEYLFYQGWNLGVSVPFRNSIGLATIKGDTVKRVFIGPILDRNIYDPCFVATPHVIKANKGYIMYYLSCFKWTDKKNNLKHQYNIKIAFSKDGIKWAPTGKTAIDFQNDQEFAISVPRVVFENKIYKMWYSFRSDANKGKYRIGYAESKNAIDWKRMDAQVGLDVSADGWDSEMICYPYIFDNNGQRYMLYNGNDYGKTGFGIAILEK